MVVILQVSLFSMCVYSTEGFMLTVLPLGLQSGSIRSSVTISFSTIFLVNQLLLEGYPNSDTAGGKWFSYKAMISLDQKQWTLLFDYSALHCYSLQRLRFPTQAAK